MTRLKFCLPWFLFLAAALPAAAASGRFAIAPDKVAGAIAGFGMQVTPAQLTMLSDAVATTTDPQLSVQSLQRWPGNRLVARIQCASDEQCLPFFVSIRHDGSAPIPDAAVIPARSSEPAVGRTPVMAVHAGSPATLYIDGDHVHISIAVTCLQNGTVGQIVRAQGPDHQQTYTAQVAGTGVLKGRL
jgi:hypothetical protein